MNYSLCKFKFTSPVHSGSGDNAKSLDGSGMTFLADTVFAALCHVAETDGGQASVVRLCELARDGVLLLSDMMPYKDDEFFVPRPSVLPSVFKNTQATDRKLMKNLKYIKLEELPDYISYVCGEGEFSVMDTLNSFGVEDAAEKVTLKGLDVSMPYSVGTYTFNSGCGLYILLAAEDVETLDSVHRLFVLLGYTGIGGKVSSGYGKFQLAEDPYTFDAVSDEYAQTRLLQRMLCEEHPAYMSITTSLPNDAELDDVLKDSCYTVCRRGGFVQSESFGFAAKKRTQFFLAAGSVFRKKYCGSLYSVADGGNHEVFRYARPLFLGVDY